MQQPTFSKRTMAMKGEAAYLVLAKAQELERQGKKIIHLEIGEPDFDTPENIKEAGIQAIRDGETNYAATLGTIELRKAIASHVEKTRGVKVSPGMVAVAPSAKTSIYLSMTAVLEPYDEVIYPNPGFPAYENMIEFLGCVPKPVPLLEEKDFSFDLDVFESLLSPKTKLVILNSPSNPTGGMLSEDDMRRIVDLLKNYNCWIATDEIYSRMLYDNIKYPSFYNLADMPERSILIDGFSKTYAMTGWRLGYIVFPENLAPAMENLMVNSFACTATFTQYAGVEALTGPQEEVEKMVGEFDSRRNIIVQGLNEIPGIECRKPQGAFYVFPNIKSLGMSSEKIADYILKEAGVALLPGTAFGKYGEGYLRLSYASSIDNIKAALGQIKEAIKKL